VLALGTAKLPVKDNAAEIIRGAIDGGVNYIDLGSPYDLEPYEKRTRLVKQALEDGYRDKVKVAASLPAFRVKSASDFGGYLDRQLDWLAAESIDFYLIGGLDRHTWPRMQQMGVTNWLDKNLADGKIGKAGFAFHDHYQTLREVIEGYDNWSLGRFQYSYMDVDHHPGTSGLRYAAGQGLGVVINEALRGGRLAGEPPQSVAKAWGENLKERSPAEWALRWVWEHPEVSTVVVDMNTLEQVRENLALADGAEANSFSVQEQILIANVRDAYLALRPVNCTACRGCMPCPQGVDAPRIFELYNDAIIYSDTETARYLYRIEGHRIEDCNECGLCSERCGRKIDIPGWLKRAGEILSDSS
jgi:predicted aldo/keto reductase-like oxidoreductase